MQIVTVNGQQYTTALLHKVARGKQKYELELRKLVENPIIVEAPAAICILGVEDVNGHRRSLLNGRYDLLPYNYNGKPCWQKHDDATKYLLWWPNGWFVNDPESRDSCGRVGVLWSGEDGVAILPTEIFLWQVFDGSEWVQQSVMVKKAHSSAIGSDLEIDKSPAAPVLSCKVGRGDAENGEKLHQVNKFYDCGEDLMDDDVCLSKISL
jgi:hypothetical protein